MKLLLNNSNPPPEESKSFKIARRIFLIFIAIVLAAFCVGLCVSIVQDEDGRTMAAKIGSCVFIAAIFIVVAILFMARQSGGSRSCLEIEDGHVYLHTYPLLIIHRKREIRLEDIVRFDFDQTLYRRGEWTAYISAKDADDKTVFNIMDCDENRRWMERLTHLPCRRNQFPTFDDFD